MKHWAIKTSALNAESIRRLLLQAGLILPGYRIQKEGDHVLIPLTYRPDEQVLDELFKEYRSLLKTISFIESEFQSRSRHLSMEELLGLSPAFDVIGDIAIIDAKDPGAIKIAETLLDINKNIKVVLGEAGSVSGEFRTRDLAVLAGEHRTVTTYIEYGCRYKVDLSRTYFSPRLGTERKRVADMVMPGQFVLDLFAGVGPFSILIARTVPTCRVVSVDINPAAIELLEENIRLNHLHNITAVRDDARLAAERYTRQADHVIMNLPHSSREYLNSGILSAKEGGIVHFYDITPGDDLYGTSWEVIKSEAASQGKSVECLKKRIVRSYAPHKYNICIEFRITGRL